MYSSSHLYPVI